MGNAFSRSRLPVDRVIVVRKPNGGPSATIEIGASFHPRDDYGRAYKEDAAKIKNFLRDVLPNGTYLELFPDATT